MKDQTKLIAVKNSYLSAFTDSEMEGQESDESEELELARRHKNGAANRFLSAVGHLGDNLTNFLLSSAGISGKSSASKASQRHRNAKTNGIRNVQNDNADPSGYKGWFSEFSTTKNANFAALSPPSIVVFINPLMHTLN